MRQFRHSSVFSWRRTQPRRVFVSCSCPPSSSVTDTGVMISRAAQCCFIVQGAHPFANSWTLSKILLRRPSFSPSAVGESVLSLVVTTQPSCHDLQPHHILQSSRIYASTVQLRGPQISLERADAIAVFWTCLACWWILLCCLVCFGHL